MRVTVLFPLPVIRLHVKIHKHSRSSESLMFLIHPLNIRFTFSIFDVFILLHLEHSTCVCDSLAQLSLFFFSHLFASPNCCVTNICPRSKLQFKSPELIGSPVALGRKLPGSLLCCLLGINQRHLFE